MYLTEMCYKILIKRTALSRCLIYMSLINYYLLSNNKINFFAVNLAEAKREESLSANGYLSTATRSDQFIYIILFRSRNREDK